MNPLRRERAPELPWIVLFGTRKAKKDWELAFRQAPQLFTEELKRLQLRPIDRSQNPRRTAPLRFELAHRRIGSKSLPQWQHELTSAGRIWYCIDQDERTVWITKVSLRHPKETE